MKELCDLIDKLFEQGAATITVADRIAIRRALNLMETRTDNLEALVELLMDERQIRLDLQGELSAAVSELRSALQEVLGKRILTEEQQKWLKN